MNGDHQKTKRRTRRPDSLECRTIVIVIPHPDDDIIGCGGTIRRYLIAGYRVVCVFLTRGERGGESGTVRAGEAVAALKSLKVAPGDIYFGPFRDTHVPYSHRSIAYLEKFAGTEVLAVFVPPVEDYHQDHRNTALASLASFRRTPSILAYKTPSALAFAPNVFVDITDHLQEKWCALKLHRSQILQNKVFVEYDALIREHAGMGLHVKVQYAEGFQVVRYRLNP